MKVLVATDGSDQATKAVEYALDFAASKKAQVTLMSVAYYSKDDFDEMPPNIQDKLEAQARAALDKAKALSESKGLSADTVLETGLVPANNIIRKAREGKFDQVFLGSTGISGFKRALMGSTAAKVVAQSCCSVTVIR